MDICVIFVNFVTQAMFTAGINTASMINITPEATGWESQEAPFLLMLKYFKKVIKVETEPGWRWILLQGKTGI
jgi:hypothetical protein